MMRPVGIRASTVRFFWCAEVGNNQDPNGFLVALEHFEVDLPGGSTCDRWLSAS